MEEEVFVWKDVELYCSGQNTLKLFRRFSSDFTKPAQKLDPPPNDADGDPHLK